MDKKGLLQKLKDIFTQEEELNFVDMKTIDGRILRVDDLAVEKSIKEISEEGEMELEDGEYQLEEGIIVKVEGGIIKEISEMEEEVKEEEVIEEEMTEEVVEEVVEETTDEVTEELTTEETTDELTEEEVVEEEMTDLEVDELIQNLQSLLDEVKGLKEGFSMLMEENEKLKVEVEKFAKAPSTEPTDVKINFKKEDKNKNNLMYSLLTNKK